MAGHVGLHDDHDDVPGGGLRAFLMDALGTALGRCPPLGEGALELRTVTYVVDPPFFGDGDIGHVAVFGTVNELAVAGAHPLALSLSAVVEAGLPLRRLGQLADSVRRAARAADVIVLDVDARVVRAGEADQVHLHTTGLGVRRQVSPAAGTATGIGVGDRLVVSAPLGGFGAHLLSIRAALGHEGVVTTDCVPLASLLARVREAAPSGALRAVYTVGRGGLASALRTCARESGFGLRVDEEALPVRYETQVALDELAVDPVRAATAGCVCLVVAAESLDTVLAVLRAHPYGRDATVVGTVVPAGTPTVELVRADGRRDPLLADAGAPARLA
ncbi:AIR synthase-related protein [Streptomyces beihaiensis]|uniref:AIR synthase-related protein n=1 Tax=Streptomyces beihaiensis TaxID=2984495 RepID=A0ABT3TS97_9ACTN|nr:AIR synthase-related protein [Streptomyces beihaiensis]MCX3059917.1 AIR synthase-related protein [Streptomyces beihaiensis]